MSVSSLLISTATVKKPVATRNAMGGVVKTYDTRIASLRCRLSYSGKAQKISETDEFGRETIRSAPVIYCEATNTNLAIAESDIITLNDIDYRIDGIYSPANHHMEIFVREIR